MSLFSWEGCVALLLGGLYGSLFGAIPGLTATLAVALFIPIAFFLDPVIALPAIIAISSVAIYAGDVGSSIARIPGTPASAAYAEELYVLSRKKGPLFSLGISAMGSAVGGIIGTALLIFSSTGIALLAKQFSSFEYFWIAVLGLTAGIFAAGKGSPQGIHISATWHSFFDGRSGSNPGLSAISFRKPQFIKRLELHRRHDWPLRLFGSVGVCIQTLRRHYIRSRGAQGPLPCTLFFPVPTAPVVKRALVCATFLPVRRLCRIPPGSRR